MRLGLEVLLDDPQSILGDARVGLICHPASVDHRYRHAADLFHAHPDINLTTLFGPQHGIGGQTQDDMIEWEGFTDARTGLPVYSLYGARRKPTAAMLAETDVLVVDLQDVGTRIYTFVSTMALAMEAAREAGKRVVVLDRPNPINGVRMGGNLLEPGHESFVGMYPLPTRHGMTIGELAMMFNEEFGIGCDLTVVPMDGWRRALWHDDTDAPWVFPSPNMPTLDTATVFPGAVHIEGTTLSEGRGTTRPFELIGAPHVDPHGLAAALERENLPGVIFRACFFEPTFQKHAREICGGVQLHVTDRDRFPAVLAGIAVFRAIIQQDPSVPVWKEPPYEYVHDRLPFDVIAGTQTLREQLTEQAPLTDIAADWEPGLAAFAEQRRPYLRYE
ncbi:MAG: exo-beta-N-acetylmuramidase NamZ family protein [Thermomicrobiales bacterium]